MYSDEGETGRHNGRLGGGKDAGLAVELERSHSMVNNRTKLYMSAIRL